MSFRAEVKVRSDRVFEQLNEQVAGQEKRHRSNDGFRCCLATKIRSPNANGLRQYLKENSSQHKAGAEGYQILQKALAEAVRPRLDKDKSADKVCGCRQQAKEEKSDKSAGIKIHCSFGIALVSPKTGAPIYIKAQRGPICIFNELSLLSSWRGINTLSLLQASRRLRPRLLLEPKL